MTLTDQTREQITKFFEPIAHTGEVYDVETEGVVVVSADEDEPSGPHPFLAVGAPTPGDACVVIDTAEGDRFVIVMSGP